MTNQSNSIHSKQNKNKRKNLGLLGLFRFIDSQFQGLLDFTSRNSAPANRD